MPPLPPLADITEGGLWFPEAASTFADSSDSLWWLITWISVAFFVPICGVMGWFMWRYRHRPSETFDPQSPSHNLPLELTWTVIPTLLIVVIFGFGFTGYLDMRTPPADAYEVRVIAKKWGWSFVYPDAGFADTKLYIPVDRPVKLRMVSQDVIHSFYVPAFRAKWDVVPGRDSTVWFECTKPGSYLYECTEYCGTGHSTMIGDDGVVAVPLEEFEEFIRTVRLEKIKELEKDLVGGGEKLYKSAGCAVCHSVDGAKLNCPTWKDLYLSERDFTDGTSAVADGAYLRESVIAPDAKIVAKYNNIMPSYKGQLEEIEIEAIIMYIRSVSEAGREEVEEYEAERDAAAEEEGGESDAADDEALAGDADATPAA